MSGKCSTGYAFRLTNILSGFDDFYIKISHFDRLKSLFIHKINKYMKDSPISDKLIIELALEPKRRKLFTQFLQDYTIKISDELWNDFKDDLSIDIFHNHIRQISMEYEGYEINRY